MYLSFVCDYVESLSAGCEIGVTQVPVIDSRVGVAPADSVQLGKVEVNGHGAPSLYMFVDCASPLCLCVCVCVRKWGSGECDQDFEPNQAAY